MDEYFEGRQKEIAHNVLLFVPMNVRFLATALGSIANTTIYDSAGFDRKRKEYT